MSINAFLAQSKAHLAETTDVCLVIGNESADLDSVISAVTFCFLAHHLKHSLSAKRYIPIIHIPSQDLHLRPELVYVLEKLGIEPQHLVCLDTLSRAVNGVPKDIILVDHNKLTKPFEGWSDVVKGILDHHMDEHLYEEGTRKGGLRIIEPVGSCVTHIVHYYLDAWRSLLATEAPDWVHSLALLACAPLLVDTVNLEPFYGRTRPKDQEVADFLLPLAFTTKQDRIDYYDGLQHAKADLSRLPTPSLLCKDYKQFSSGIEVGIAAVTWTLQRWAQREGGLDKVMEQCRAWFKERGVDVGVIMTAFDHEREGRSEEEKKRGFERELVVMVIESKGRFLLERLVEDRDHQVKSVLDLREMKIDDQHELKDAKAWRQLNIKSSRKQVWPFLQELIQM
ncbi:hypothetical protein BZG36_04474 [Bifiguratus adelaidae]|uniref:DHHA2 domain-containing protein n=1 Tax=Bifiguratus adelaidae TaxID=1938954 RepID=A0A261XVI4_9FUNG|nr:hypothetical protein BZG36_04474 [Bifiguratus adelaidae]